MIHERVDIERWKALFPLAELRSKAREKDLERSREQPPDPLPELLVIPEPPRLDVLPGQPLPSVDVDHRAETGHEASEDELELPDAPEQPDTLPGPGGELITSPFHIAVVESLREEVFAERPPGTAVPVDVFIFSKGEGSRREATKVGGLPYRAASASRGRFPARGSR